MDAQVQQLFSSVLTATLAAVVAILAYMLREKNEQLRNHDKRIAALETAGAVQLEVNKHNDEKLDAIDKKMDRILQKLDA